MLQTEFLVPKTAEIAENVRKDVKIGGVFKGYEFCQKVIYSVEMPSSKTRGFLHLYAAAPNNVNRSSQRPVYSLGLRGRRRFIAAKAVTVGKIHTGGRRLVPGGRAVKQTEDSANGIMKSL